MRVEGLDDSTPKEIVRGCSEPAQLEAALCCFGGQCPCALPDTVGDDGIFTGTRTAVTLATAVIGAPASATADKQTIGRSKTLIASRIDSLRGTNALESVGRRNGPYAPQPQKRPRIVPPRTLSPELTAAAADRLEGDEGAR